MCMMLCLDRPGFLGGCDIWESWAVQGGWGLWRAFDDLGEGMALSTELARLHLSPHASSRPFVAYRYVRIATDQLQITGYDSLSPPAGAQSRSHHQSGSRTQRRRPAEGRSPGR